MKVAVIEGGQFLLTPQFTIDRSVVTEKKDPEQAFRDLAQIVSELRQEAKDKGLDSMPAKEINRAVAAARRDSKKKTSKRPAK